MLSISGNPASCTASNIGVRRRVFLEALSLGGSDDALLLSPDGMDLVLCCVEGAYDDFELAGLLVEVLEEHLVELPVVSMEVLRKGGNSSLV
jgi:hypothetical protein